MNGIRCKERADAQRRHQKTRLDSLNKLACFRKQRTNTLLLTLFLAFTKQDRQCAPGRNHIKRRAHRGKLSADFCLIDFKLLSIFLGKSTNRFILRNSIECRQNRIPRQNRVDPLIVKLLLECADNILWLYILTNGSIYIRHDLLIIQLGEKTPEMAPVIQLVHFIQAIHWSRQYQNRRCRVSTQNRSIKVPVNSLECISTTIRKSRIEFLMILRKFAPFGGKIVVVSQRTKRNAAREYCPQRRHLFRYIIPFGFDTMIGFTKKCFDGCFSFNKLQGLLLIIGKSFCHGDSFIISRFLPVLLAQAQVGDKLLVLGIEKPGKDSTKLFCQLLVIRSSIQFINIIVKRCTQHGAGSHNICTLRL